ncbi:alpha/beta hydrolase [Halosquirtibacter xylanolyticus]|uniref:alpha/beta hydrolase n=1 Tax=Halosquirtibacter xylanolyticus TaxID=3374599 RepID=UPI003749468F|nr:alpha/beta hydrolase [Prolixibacteraceae bacterium]
MRKILLLTFYLIFIMLNGFAQKKGPDKKIAFKYTPQGKLSLHAFYPPTYDKNKSYPTVIFFFGGGWVKGGPAHFYGQAEHLSSLGLICYCAEYRTRTSHNTSPYECVKDAKSAVRYVRENAKELGVNPNLIATSGGSAGGHLAICCAMITNINDDNDDLRTSAVPNLCFAYNPILDTTEKGFGSDRMLGNDTILSPLHNVRSHLPPILIMTGTKDKCAKWENALDFRKEMRKNKNDLVLRPFFGQEHSFFNNQKRKNPKKGDIHYKFTLYESELFLWMHGFLSKEPTWEYNFFHKG